jgi:calcium-dependent protein kinase
LQVLDHPNIVKYLETYNDEKFVYLVMEYCAGGALITHLCERGTALTELEAARIMKNLVDALMHFHDIGLVHRDIKPENIMFDDHENVKLIDFGLATHTNLVSEKEHIAGSPYYIAPECLDGKYDKPCDIWSIGVLLYLLVTGILPFSGKDSEEVFFKAEVGKYPKKPLQNLSPECQDFIAQMLTVNPSKRITTQQAL